MMLLSCVPSRIILSLAGPPWNLHHSVDLIHGSAIVLSFWYVDSLGCPQSSLWLSPVFTASCIVSLLPHILLVLSGLPWNLHRYRAPTHSSVVVPSFLKHTHSDGVVRSFLGVASLDSSNIRMSVSRPSVKLHLYGAFNYHSCPVPSLLEATSVVCAHTFCRHCHVILVSFIIIYIYIYIYRYRYTYIYIYVCVYIYIYTYIHSLLHYFDLFGPFFFGSCIIRWRSSIIFGRRITSLCGRQRSHGK